MSAARILVVDDSLTIRRALEFILKPHGYALEFAADGREALDRAAAFTPDLVLLDYVLPDMRGPDVCAALAVMPATSRTPVILVSAKGASIRQAYQDAQNVVSYITKPFKAEVVAAVVGNALARHHASASAGPAEQRFATSAATGAGVPPAAPPSPIPDGHTAEASPATVEETFSALLAQLEEAITTGPGVPQEQGPRAAAAGIASTLTRLGPGLARATLRMRDLEQHLIDGTVAPFRLRRDGSFADVATTLLEAHRSLCEAALALAAAGTPATRPAEQTHLVAACPPRHPLHEELSTALRLAPEVTAVVLDSEFGQLPFLVRLLAPRSVVVAVGCDAELDEAARRTNAERPPGSRFLALGETPTQATETWPGSEQPQAEASGEARDERAALGLDGRLEDAAAVARLVGELASERSESPQACVDMGLEIVTV